MDDFALVNCILDNCGLSNIAVEEDSIDDIELTVANDEIEEFDVVLPDFPESEKTCGGFWKSVSAACGSVSVDCFFGKVNASSMRLVVSVFMEKPSKSLDGFFMLLI